VTVFTKFFVTSTFHYLTPGELFTADEVLEVYQQVDIACQTTAVSVHKEQAGCAVLNFPWLLTPFCRKAQTLTQWSRAAFLGAAGFSWPACCRFLLLLPISGRFMTGIPNI